MNFSCKDCEEKHGGCHATCETYKREKKAFEEKMEIERKRRAIDNGIHYERERKIQTAKRRAKHVKRFFT